MSCGTEKFIKDPDARLDYEYDWSAWLKDDTIDTATFSANDPGITIALSVIGADRKRAFVWLADGEEGRQYKVTCSIVTVGGRMDDRTVRFQIAQK